jgi:hypothetical protein
VEDLEIKHREAKARVLIHGPRGEIALIDG